MGTRVFCKHLRYCEGFFTIKLRNIIFCNFSMKVFLAPVSSSLRGVEFYMTVAGWWASLKFCSVFTWVVPKVSVFVICDVVNYKNRNCFLDYNRIGHYYYQILGNDHTNFFLKNHNYTLCIHAKSNIGNVNNHYMVS